MTQVNDSKGVQAGSGNVQINLFVGEQPRGPVVAGSIPQAPPAFQPREDLMAQLRAAGPGVAVVRAVTGLRGVGKTQLAAAYARECIDAGWRLVAWINAEDIPGILSGLALVAERIGIDRPGTVLETIGAEIRNRLEADGDHCLVVYDNVTDPDAIRPYVPAAGKSQVVVTSTNASALALGKPTAVGVFTEQESFDFLAQRTGLSDRTGAAALADELGHLPLALAQAAAVIRAQHLTYPVYQERLGSKSAGDYLKPTKEDPYPRGAAEAILLSIEATTPAGEADLCGGLLGVIALLSPDGVPRDLLYLGESQDVFDVGPEAIDEALARLSGASLLTYGGGDESSPSVTAHRLVMRVVRERHARDGTLTVIAAKAIALLAAGASSLGEPWQHRSAARNLVAQVIALTDHVAVGDAADDETLAGALLDRRRWASRCLYELRDSAAQAIGLGVPLVTDCSRMLGEDHPGTLTSRNILALCYLDAGRVGEAIPLFERTLADRVRVLGGDHPDTLTSRRNLALAYRAAGRLGEATSLYERTLADRVRVFGEDHPDTLTSQSNLAAVYRDAGRAGEAIPLQERTLASRVRVLGDDHPDTLRSRNNLASAYQAAGRLGEAIPLYERTLASRVQVLGDDHPETLTSRNNLASGYQAAGRLDEAIPLFERTLADRVRMLGDLHPDTLVSRNNLALAYQDAGRLVEAIVLLEEAVVGFEQVLGARHPNTVTARNSLARARAQAGQQSG